MDEKSKEMLDSIKQIQSESLAEFKKNNVDGLNKAIEDGNAKFDALEAKLDTLAAAQSAAPSDRANAAAAEGMRDYFRTGVIADVKNISREGTGADGGYLVPPTIASNIVKHADAGNPIRELATVVSTGTSEYAELEENGADGGAWVNETGTRSATDTPTVLKNSAAVHECYAVLTVTNALMQDASFDIESYLVGAASRKFAKLENQAFYDGAGNAAPRGIATYDKIAEANWEAGKLGFVAGGSASDITADALVNLQDALDSQYQPNATFLMNKKTFTALRKLKAGANGANLFMFWTPELEGGKLVNRLMGSSVRIWSAMPDVAANAFPVIYGDIREAYAVVDRLGMTIVRDNVTAPGFTKLYCYRRVGGMIRNSEAVKFLKIAAN